MSAGAPTAAWGLALAIFFAGVASIALLGDDAETSRAFHEANLARLEAARGRPLVLALASSRLMTPLSEDAEITRKMSERLGRPVEWLRLYWPNASAADLERIRGAVVAKEPELVVIDRAMMKDNVESPPERLRRAAGNALRRLIGTPDREQAKARVYHLTPMQFRGAPVDEAGAERTAARWRSRHAAFEARRGAASFEGLSARQLVVEVPLHPRVEAALGRAAEGVRLEARAGADAYVDAAHVDRLRAPEIEEALLERIHAELER